MSWPALTDRTVGAILREVRIVNGMTIKELGRATGTNWQSVARHERGRQSIPVAFLYRAARACGVPVGVFFGERDPAAASEFFTGSVPSPEEAQALARLWRRIPDERLRLALRVLVFRIANSADPPRS